MGRILTYFARGCLALVPLTLTLYAVYVLVETTDAWLGVEIPGLGLLITLICVTATGFFVSHFIGRQIYTLSDKIMERVPVLRLLYRALRDLVSALVGERTSFGSPVIVRLSPTSEVRALGFLAQPDLEPLGLPDLVAVYLPQAYNIAGQLILVPRALVEPLGAAPADVLSFVLSGGATTLPSTRERPSRPSL